MHKVKQFWSNAIFREAVEPETVYENRLSATEVSDGYLNLSNMDIPARCFIEQHFIQVILINTHNEDESPVMFRCHERKTKGKKGKIFKRQRFWPVGFGLKEWFMKQQLITGDLILMAVSLKHNYLIFRAFRPKTLLLLHDRRATERRDLERRTDDRRQTMAYISMDRRRKDRRALERRNLERRKHQDTV
jgi:hypothetical protein